jgi:UDP-3-O-[3-hydroxymyristoyl] glucosamine N-acyltransferase
MLPIKAKDIITFLQLDENSLMGNDQTPIHHFVLPDSQQDNSLAFINHSKWITKVNSSSVSCVLVSQDLRDQVSELVSDKTWIFCPNVDLCAREVKNHFFLATPYVSQNWKDVHPTAHIHPSANLAEGVSVGPYAVIGANCKIGKHSHIGAHAVIEDQVEIGTSCTIHPQVYIGHSCQLGSFCEVKPHAVIGSEGFGYAHDQYGHHHRIPHSGPVILRDHVHVGAGTTIDRGTIAPTIIGEGTKIDNQCHLAHNTVIGNNGLLAGQVATAGSTTIGNNFICGGKTAINGHITITDNVSLAGMSGVTNSVLKSGAYGGYPILPFKEHLKVKTSAAHIPSLRKQVNRILRHLFPEDFKDLKPGN